MNISKIAAFRKLLKCYDKVEIKQQLNTLLKAEKAEKMDWFNVKRALILSQKSLPKNCS